MPVGDLSKVEPTPQVFDEQPAQADPGGAGAQPDSPPPAPPAVHADPGGSVDVSGAADPSGDTG